MSKLILVLMFFVMGCAANKPAPITPMPPVAIVLAPEEVKPIPQAVVIETKEIQTQTIPAKTFKLATKVKSVTVKENIATVIYTPIDVTIPERPIEKEIKNIAKKTVGVLVLILVILLLLLCSIVNHFVGKRRYLK